MERWTALLPDRQPTTPLSPKVKLHGRLPEAAYISILQHLPVPDIPQFALCSRKLAQLSRDDRVWNVKLAWMDYKGPGAVAWREGSTEGPPIVEEPAAPPPPSSSSGAAKHASAASPSFGGSDDEFGDFFEGDVESSAQAQDDGFGDFQDSRATTKDADPFGLAEDFTSVSLTQPPAPVKKKRDSVDLLMMFDEEEDVVAVSAPAPPAARRRPPEIKKPSQQFSTRLPPTAPSPTTPTTSHTSTSLRTVFITHHNLLLPYYLSLLQHTTSSLVFTSSTLTPHTRSQVLSSLVRFCQPLVAPTRSLPQRMTVLRNVQSAMDFFESALIAEFERADNRHDEAVMKEKATVLRELNQSTSVVQVFVQKREIFYDQSHNPLKNLIKVENPEGGEADGIDFSAMDAYMRSVLAVVEREGGLIARVFPPEADVLIYFTERIANDVISDYITSLLSAAQPLQHPIFLLATAATFGQVYRLVDAVLAIEPKSPMVTKERAEDVIFKMFEPLMDDYLTEEGEWIREVLEGMCRDWDEKTASDLAISDPTFLASQNPAQVKKNVLAGFTKVLLLPVTIIPKTATFGLNAITTGATGAFNTFASLGGGLGGVSGSNSRARTPVIPSSVESPPSTPTAVLPPSIESSSTAWGGDPLPPTSSSSSSRVSLSHSTPSTSRPSSISIAGAPPPASSRFDRLQLLLSLDTALQLIQADRDCLKRVQTFIRYPGTYGRKVRDAIEEVFIILLQTLGEKHVCPAFAKAAAQMGAYKPEEHERETQVAPLVQFFELVHIGDTIQQMVEVYFEKEMAAYIDKKDFLNTVVREKKKFEASLDDAVAQGLNAGVNILMNQVEHIILTHQGLRDFSPAEGADLDLQPTAACKEAIEVLVTHCDMLKGSTDKQILEVFHQEVGIRLHGIILKHVKRQIVSVEGGFQLISDLNAYHSFISSLRQPTVTAYFSSLKMVGEIYIVDSPKELGGLVRDVSRYEGTLSADDLYEIVQRRADWQKISVQVEKQLFGLKLADDCVVS